MSETNCGRMLKFDVPVGIYRY